MLKIKDNVDLKELEKFGFEYYTKNLLTYGYTNRELHIAIDLKSREMFIREPFRDNDGEENNLTIVYDLIKADLVEKVGVDIDE